MNTNENAVKQAAGTEVTFFIPNTESLGKLKEMNPSFSLTMKYKSADDWAQLKDKPIRVFYMGLKDVPNEDGENVKCGVFVSDHEVFLSGQMVLVEAVKNLKPQTPLQITYRGKRSNKSGTGSTMLFDVETLA